MGIDYPPPQPPQLGQLEQLQQTPETAAVTFKEFKIHWLGAKPLSDAQLQAAVENRETLSDAVRSLWAIGMVDGLPLYILVWNGVTGYNCVDILPTRT